MLPQHLEPEVAKNEPHWWYDPRYIINELNVNVRFRNSTSFVWVSLTAIDRHPRPQSAIVKPAHDEVLDIATAGATYKVTGYAYAGGGRRVNRVEVSLDTQNWQLADIT
jgi:nitrate reductase (NAD(P)H)